MKKCNVCNKTKPNIFYKKNKKTCRGCERTFANWLLRLLVQSRRLTPIERLGNRLGYMGSAFIMLSPYLLPYDNMGAIYIFDWCIIISTTSMDSQTMELSNYKL